MTSKILGLLIGLFFLQMSSCDKTDITAVSNLEGNWLLKNVFLSDAIDTPCGWEAGEHEPINFDVKKESDNYSFGGNSVVNAYFGNLKVLSYDKDTKTGKLEISNLGSTKKAGPPLLMNCETRFFNQLQTAIDFGFDEEGLLKIGTFRNENSHPRDGGYYLIFEKSE